jgi:hypothetical protein
MNFTSRFVVENDVKFVIVKKIGYLNPLLLKTKHVKEPCYC